MPGRLQTLRSYFTAQHRKDASQPDLALVSFLAGHISEPKKAGAVLDAVAGFKKQQPEARTYELPAIYLLLEQYLTDIDARRPFTRPELRSHVRLEFSSLLASPSFSLIFEPAPVQEILLCRSFLLEALKRATTVLGGTEEGILAGAVRWVEAVPSHTELPAPFGVTSQVPASPEAWVPVLIRLSQELHRHLARRLGEAGDRIYEAGYRQLARQYTSLESFPIIIRLLPETLLDEHKIQHLVRDSTLRKVQGALSEARMAALESAAQLQAVLNTVGEGIVTVDSGGAIVLVNREVEQIFGYTQDELIGRNLDQLLKEASFYEPSAAHGLHVPLGRRLEITGFRKDGSSFPLEVSVNETRIENLLFYTAALRDITSRKRFESELIAAKEHAEEMTRLKTIFLANMSHELRTPLTGIMGFAQVLGEEVSKDQQEFTRLIHESGQRLLDTLNSVLDFARIEAEGLIPVPAPIDVSDHVALAVEPFRARAQEKSIALLVETPPQPVHADLDTACFERIITNLVDNAVKFTERGTITVRVAEQDENILIRVIDTGIGVSPEFLPYLFDGFKQESTGLSRTYQGAGLGLAIAKRMAAGMGCTLTVESERGKGSTFTVLVPSKTAAPSGRPPRGSSSTLIEETTVPAHHNDSVPMTHE